LIGLIPGREVFFDFECIFASRRLSARLLLFLFVLFLLNLIG
jgi:hypothetical protein